MKNVWLASHGNGEESVTVLVPEKIKIKCYTAANTSTLRSIGIQAIAEAGSSGPRETFRPGQPMRNYMLSWFPDTESQAEHVAAQTSLTGPNFYILGFEGNPGGILTMRKIDVMSALAILRQAHPDMKTLHLIACRPHNESAGIPLSYGSKERGNAMTDTNAAHGFYEDGDDRLTINNMKKARQLYAKAQQDPQATLSEMENWPQATAAVMRSVVDDTQATAKDKQLNPREYWKFATRSVWPEKPDGTSWSAAYGKCGPPPGSPYEAWKEMKWRNAFYAYIHGPAGVDTADIGTVKANLRFWAATQAFLVPEEFEDDDAAGKEVLDTEILHIAQGNWGPQPFLAGNSFGALEYSIGTLSRLHMAKLYAGTEEFEGVMLSLEDSPELLAMIRDGIDEAVRENPSSAVAECAKPVIDKAIALMLTYRENSIKALAEEALTGGHILEHWDNFVNWTLAHSQPQGN